MAAAAGGQAEAASLLLAAGAALETSDPETGGTALNIAAHNGNLAVLQVLLDAGADIYHNDKASVTALHAAAAQGRLELVRELIARGAPVDLTSEKKGDNLGGITPLIYAALGGHNDVAHYLIEEAGADPNILPTMGRPRPWPPCI